MTRPFTISNAMRRMAAPKIGSMRTQSNLQAAQVDMVSYLNRARAAAISRGHPIRFKRAGSSIMVIDSLVTPRDTIARPRALDTYGVSLSASRDWIDFDTRGFGIGLNSAVTFTLTRSGVTKQICTSILGLVAKNGTSCS